MGDYTRNKEDQKVLDKRLDKKVDEVCLGRVDTMGNHVRGFVSMVTCQCGLRRHDDGTRCQNCGQYYGSVTRMGLEDEGRG